MSFHCIIDKIGGVYPLTIKKLTRPLHTRIVSAYIDYIKKYHKEKYADFLFEEAFGRTIDWKHPRDLNEWIQYLQFRTDTREWSRLADKYAVREYVKERGCEEILVPFYGKWERPEDIDYSLLPEKFVLKTNHGAG